MTDMMQFDLVSPERRLARYQARAVKVPGVEGDLTAMPNHAPLITTLRPGVVHVDGEQGSDEFIVTGGFAQVTPEGIAVLAEESYHRDEMSQEMLDRMVEDAAEKQRKAVEASHNEPGPADDAAKLLADMMAMGSHIGLSPKQSNL